MLLPTPKPVLDALRLLDACTICNAIETFGLRLRNEGFTDSSIRCLFPQLATVAGHAVTVRMRCSSPPTDCRAYLDRTDWWNYIRSLPQPRVVVIEDVDPQAGLGSFVGEVHANILRALGCVAVVTNGTVRDLAALRATGLQFFAGGAAVSHAYAHIVEFGATVTVGGLKVQSGDLLVGDLHGVLTVPLDVVPQIPLVAAEILQRERRLVEFCRSPAFSVEQLRDLVRDQEPGRP